MKLKTKYLGWSCFSSKIIKLILVKTVVGGFLLNGQINISLFITMAPGGVNCSVGYLARRESVFIYGLFVDT